MLLEYLTIVEHSFTLNEDTKCSLENDTMRMILGVTNSKIFHLSIDNCSLM